MDTESGINLSNIATTLKENWLQIGFVEKEEEKHNTLILQKLFCTYSQLHQIPKLLSKLFLAINEVILENSTGVYFRNGCISSPVLRTFADCVIALPVGQTFDVWELFIDVSQTFPNMSQPAADITANVMASDFVTSQLFSTFLYHMHLLEDNILPVVQNRLEAMLKQTDEMLQHKAHVLKEEFSEMVLSHMSFLTLLHAHKEVELAYRTVTNISSFKTEFEDPCCSFTVFPYHLSVDCNFVEICEEYLKHGNREFQYWMMKLLTQSIQTVSVAKHPKDVNSKTLKSAASFLLSTVIESSNDTTAYLNQDLRTISHKDYRFALWELLLNNIPVFMPFLNQRKLVMLCSSMIGIVLEESSELVPDFKTKISHLLKIFFSSGLFQNSAEMQTAFITALWRYCANLVRAPKRSFGSHEGQCSSGLLIFRELGDSELKWEKYVHSTPKDSVNGSSSKMWSSIKSCAGILNEMLADSSKSKGKVKLNLTSHMLKILAYLPLEFLIPGNQMRCLIGLSTLLVLLEKSISKETESYLESKNQCDEIIKNVITIFEGVRSIWLFDFVEPNLYFRLIVQLVEKTLKVESLGVPFSLNALGRFFDLSIKNPRSFLSIEDYLSELFSNVEASLSSALIFSCLFHRIVQLLQRNFLNQQLREACNRLAVQACNGITKTLRLKKHDDAKIYSIMGNCYCEAIKLIYSTKIGHNFEKKYQLIEDLPQILHYGFQVLEESKDESETTFSLNLICAIAANKQHLEQCLSKDFVTQLWKMFQLHITSKTPNNINSNEPETANQSDIICVTIEDDLLSSNELDNNFQNWESLRKVSDSSTVSSSKRRNYRTFELSELEQKALSSIIVLSSVQEFHCILQEIMEKLVSSTHDVETMNVASFQALLCSGKVVYSSPLKADKTPIFSDFSENFLMCLHYTTSQIVGRHDRFFAVTKPTLDFLFFVLQLDKVKISTQSAVQCLHSCISLKIGTYIEKSTLFIEAFTAMWNILNSLLMNYLHVILSASSPYIYCATDLLKSIVQAGNQDFVSSCSPEVQKAFQLCAQSIEKLFIALSKQETALAKVVPYMVADYVHTVQHVTVHPSVKGHIVRGINHLLDICSEDSIRMLAVNNSHTCREIFNNLVKFHKQNKFSGNI